MIDESGIFLLKVDLVAAGTKLRVGAGRHEFHLVEHLSLGDEIYDPIQEKLIEITEMACVTLDRETIRDRGFSPKKLGDDSENSLIYAVKVPKILGRTGSSLPIRGEYHLSEGLVFLPLDLSARLSWKPLRPIANLCAPACMRSITSWGEGNRQTVRIACRISGNSVCRSLGYWKTKWSNNKRA